MNQNPPIIYIRIFKRKKIIHSSIQCDKCGKFFTLQEDNKYIDGYVWRCRSRNPPHNIRILTFYCFCENKGVIKSVIECNK